jgi:predicted nucleotidyltransferase component of viral defense system
VIDKREVLEFSKELGLAPNVVEKDYVLGWLLAGIGHHEELSASWIFKGGTCLKSAISKRIASPKTWTLPSRIQVN